MSNVIIFPVRAKLEQPAAAKFAPEVPVTALLSTYTQLSSVLLLEGLDKLEGAIAKLATLVDSLPDGEARRQAEKELGNINVQIATARAMSIDVVDTTADAPPLDIIST